MNGIQLFAQTPREIKQIDKHQENFWESPTAMILAAVLIIALIVSRKWSAKILKKRDQTIGKDKE